MTVRNKIEGVLRLTRPMHCSAGAAKIDGRSINQTMTQPIFPREGRQYIPYFPGNDTRGRVRRFAAEVILDRITADKRIKRELLSGLTSGAESAQPDSSPLTVEEVLRARDDLFMGIFGGGARILRSQWRTDDLVPILQSTIEVGMVPSHFGETNDENFLPTVWRDGERVPARGTDLFHEYNITRVDDVFRVLRGDMLAKYLEDPVNTVAAYQQSILENKKSRKEDETGNTKKADVGNMLSVQAIAAGTPMYFHLEFTDALSDAQVGLLCHAVCDFVNAQDLGGFVSKGLGRFEPNLMLTRHDNVTPLLAKRQDGRWELAGEAAALQEQMQVALASVTADALLEFYMPRKKGEE